ncbi:GABA transporter 1 [Coccomyxa sp. Obi]|nr:GABA transporter 1 [Coccomyxa sp. Obi]
MGLDEKNGMNDSAHGNKLDYSKDTEGQMEVADEQAMPEYVGKGEWYHIGYHMTAAVASVPTLGLPFAVSLLGWGGGLVALIAGGAVTMFTSFLVSSMLEYGGKRHIRFRDLAVAVFGKSGWWAVTPFQFAVCIGTTIANCIVGGQAIKAIDVLARGETPVTLTEYIVLFGGVNLLLAQCPNFHSIRFINQSSTFCTISFSLIAVAMSIYAGTTQNTEPDYSVPGDGVTKLFNVFNGLGIMAFAYGNTVIPEIGATAKAPAIKTMRGGIIMGYCTIVSAYLCVSITGYWAFGNGVTGIVLGSLTNPGWVVIMAWAFAALQLIGTTQVYCQPIYEFCDKTWGDILAPTWCLKNTVVRLVCRTIFICFCTLIGSMLPFFTDFMSLIGAIGFTPMDFVLPQFLWIAAYKPKGFGKWFSILVAVIYIIVGIMACIGAVRSIVLNAVNYSLFANL